ncbi:Cut9-interacting protein scn1 [Savitreella phatthalungensis]
MATREHDQDHVASIALRWPRKVIPCFGFHPWFVHFVTTETSNGDATSEVTSTSKYEHIKQVVRPSPPDDFIDTVHDLVPAKAYVQSIEDHFVKFPNAMLGEVGLDKAFRIPDPRTKSSDDSSGSRGRLTKHQTDMSHQVAVLEAQLATATKFQRAVSLHGVQAHGALHHVIDKLWRQSVQAGGSKRERKRAAWRDRAASATSTGLPGQRDNRVGDDGDDDEGEDNVNVDDSHHRSTKLEFFRDNSDQSTLSHPSYPPRVCLHSFSGAVDMIATWLRPGLPIDVFFSFSRAVNGRYDRWHTVMAAVPDDRILIESDLHDASLIDEALEGVLADVCRAKEWDERHARIALERNWHRFVYGSNWHDKMPPDAFNDHDISI